MSLLNEVSHSSQSNSGLRVVIGGVEKVGKTTLATGAPRTLLVPMETGYSGVSVMRTPKPETFEDVMELLEDIKAQSIESVFPYKSLVFDSATALEVLIHNATLERDPLYSPGNKKTVTMDSALGGYGKGYAFANGLFRDFLNICDELAEYGGINIILTAHVFAGKILDPTTGEYDTWDLLLHSPKNQKTYGKREMLTQWADLVGFMHEPVFISEGKVLNKAISAGKGRVLGLSRTPGYVAGNRLNMTGVIPIPKEENWNSLAEAIHAACGIDVYNRDV
jgi:hypothetical protein